MKKYKGIIFDLDGTLIDTSLGIYNCVRYAEKQLGLKPLDDDTLIKFIGPSSLYSYTTFHGLDNKMASKAIEYHYEYSKKRGLYEAKVYDGIIELLEQLKSMDLTLAVATLKKEDIAKKMLKHFKIGKFFDVISGMNKSNTLSKADLINVTSKRMMLNNKKDILMIGDSKFDAIGAQKSNVDFMAVTYGFGFKNNKDIEEYKNVFVVSNPNAILSYLN